MEAREFHRRACDQVGRIVTQVRDDQWSAPTPCADWDMKTLLNHLVGENVWMPPLLAGKTVADMGDAFEGDLVGDDPKHAWENSVEEATEAIATTDADPVHVSFGDIPRDEYITQVASDLVIHSWDLARGAGTDDSLDDALVEATYGYIAPQADAWRAGGAFGDAVEVPEDSDTQTKLLALTGRKA